jgi:hypothetical protein
MSVIAPTSTYFDFRKVLTKKKLLGLWRMMAGFRLAYTGANLSLAISALAKTTTYLLLRNFADTVVGNIKPFAGSLPRTLAWLALGFIGLALVEGSFSFISGRLAAFSAEGITRRLRNFLMNRPLASVASSCFLSSISSPSGLFPGNLRWLPASSYRSSWSFRSGFLRKLPKPTRLTRNRKQNYPPLCRRT